MAEGLLEAGASTAIIARSTRIYEAASTLSGEVFPIQADLGERAALEAAFNESLKMLGIVDILVVNHGIQHRAPAEAFAIDDWSRVLEVNLTSVFLLNQLAGRVMLEKGGGKIINVASLLSFSGGLTVPAYAAAKSGVARLTMALSNEWASRGVNVNAIAPGYMETDMNEALINDDARARAILDRIPAGRWGRPTDMKGVVIFLASPASDYVHGAVIPVDGGWMGR